MEPVATKVVATGAALEVIGRLVADYGPVLLFQSGGRCDGSSPICMRASEFALGPHDLLLGEVGGAPFYIDRDQYERWNRPEFVLDAVPGAAEGFSLEGLAGMHFVVRSEACAI